MSTSSTFWFQALKAIGASSRTLLGPQRSVKAILNSGDTVSSCLVADTLSLLHVLDIKHPIAGLLIDVCESQQKVCGNGCTTLVNMAVGWSQAIQTLSDQGIPLPVVLCLFDEALSLCEETCLFEIQRLDVCTSLSCDSSSSKIYTDTLLGDQLVEVPTKASLQVSEAVTMSDEDVADMNDTNWYFEGSNDLEVKLDAISQHFSSSNGCIATAEKSIYDMFGMTELQRYTESDMDRTFSMPFEATPQANMMSALKDNIYCSPTTVATENSWEVHEFNDDFSFEESLPYKTSVVSTTAKHLCEVEPHKTEHKKEVTANNNHVFKSMTEHVSSRLFSLLNSRNSLLKPSQYIMKGSRHLNRHDMKHMDDESVLMPKRRQVQLSTQIKSHADCSAELCCNNDDKTGIVDGWILLKKLCSGLSHGMDFEMSLVEEIVCFQSGQSPRPKLDMSRVFAASMIGPNKSHSRVVEGIVVETKLSREILQANGQMLSILVVVGDVSPHFKHLGYKSNTNVHRVVELGNEDRHVATGEQAWVEQLEEALKLTDVGLVIVQGHVDVVAADVCCRMGVAIVDGVDSQQLSVLCDSTGAQKLTYLHMAKPDHVGKYVEVSLCGEERLLTSSPSAGNKTRFHLEAKCSIGKCHVIFRSVERMTSATCPTGNETSPSSIITSVGLENEGKLCVTTAILCAPSFDIADMMAKNFWKCAHRIKNCLSGAGFLPGGGHVELSCCRKLRRVSRDCDIEIRSRNYPWVDGHMSGLISEFRSVAFPEFAIALETFVAQTTVNMGRYRELYSAIASNRDNAFDAKQTVYDDFRSKLEAWKKAGNLVKLLAQTSSMISFTN